MTAYTKGPWTVQLTGNRGGFFIPEAQKHEAEAADTDGIDGYSVSKANARLIAKAPAMLEVLKCFCAAMDMNLGHNHEVALCNAEDMARAIIKEAEGK